MKIVHISVDGVTTPHAVKVAGKTGRYYYCLQHGEAGRGRWQVRIPLRARDFPASEESADTMPVGDDYHLVPLDKRDPAGNPLYILERGPQDGQYLVLWSLSPGFRGSASFAVEGSATVVAEGREAQGHAGRVGGATCPVVLVTGPCRLTWQRFGRLYGAPAEWVASYDGQSWTVGPALDLDFEAAVFE